MIFSYFKLSYNHLSLRSHVVVANLTVTKKQVTYSLCKQNTSMLIVLREN